MQPNAYYSNDIETLYQFLKKSLFEDLSAPFAERIIIIPSAAMKSWLTFKLANDPDLKIATGIHLLYLDQAVAHLQHLQDEKNPFQRPSKIELAFAIENEIKKQIEDGSIERSLEDYLKGKKSNSERKFEKRLTTLSHRLAALFSDYDLYGQRMVQNWLKNSPEWQHQLWVNLFLKENYSITSLLKIVPKKILKKKTQLHCFALSYLPPFYHQLFLKLKNEIALSYYLLSPCKMFWSDLLTSKESDYLEKKMQDKLGSDYDIEHYFEKHNPLLMSLGKVGRKMAQQIEESEVQTFSQYTLPQSIQEHAAYDDMLDDEIEIQSKSSSLSILEALKANLILDLHIEKKSQLELLEEENPSIAVHVASSKMRECEILYNAIAGIIDQGNGQILPSDIIIMAPDIKKYSAYLKAIFNNSESKLNAYIMDRSLLSESELLKSFIYLLTLPISRWDANSIYKLFEIPSFRKRHGITLEESRTIRNWIDSYHVRWGHDPQHRSELLQKDYAQTQMEQTHQLGTWDYAFGKLIYSQLKSDYQTDESGDMTSSIVLGKFIGLIESLKDDLGYLHEGKKHTLKEWADYLKILCGTYFEMDQNDEKALQKVLQRFYSASRNVKGTFSSTSILFHLKQLLDQTDTTSNDLRLNAIHCCSMLPMRAVPAKIIALIGMEEDSYPRTESKSTLDLLRQYKDADFRPSQSDYDRFLFLETIISAKQYLLLSYVGYDTSGKEQQPSLLVTELLSYLDKTFLIEGKKPSQKYVIKHPFHSFDSTNFQAESHFKNYMPFHYKAAKALYSSNKKEVVPFIPSFSKRDKADLSNSIKVSLQEMAAVARNPIKFYLNKKLGIYLESQEDRVLNSDDTFEFSSLSQYQLKHASLTDPLQTILSKDKYERLFPLGQFNAVAKDRIANQLTLLQSQLIHFGVECEQIKPLHLSDVQAENHFPALALKIDEKHIKINGLFPHVCSEGLICYAKDEKGDLLKVWPQYLAFCMAVDTYQLPYKKNLVLIKGQNCTIKDCFVDDVQAYLENYVAYYFLASQELSPLMPEWIPMILKNDPIQFSQKVADDLQNPFSMFKDKYLEWTIKFDQLPDAQQLVDQWQPVAEKLFSKLL